MVKITSSAPSKDIKHIVKKESLIEIPLGNDGRVYNPTTRVNTHVNNNNNSARCLFWMVMALSICSLTFTGVRTVGNMRLRLDCMANRIDVLRAEKAYLEALVQDNIDKSQFLAKIYSHEEVISYVDQEPEPFTDKWSFNIAAVWTSDYITYCDMYWLSRNIANRIYDKVIQVPRVIKIIENIQEDDNTGNLVTSDEDNLAGSGLVETEDEIIASRENAPNTV